MFICYNNPNWADSALKRCDYFKERWGFACGHCCNCDICDKLKQEEREKEIAEMRESLLDMQELKLQMCEPESMFNNSVYYTMTNNGTWRVVDQNEYTTTIRYVHEPDW